MPRYVIERTFDVDEDEMFELNQRSRKIAMDQFPDIVWEYSHVVVDDEGTLKSFCVYSATNEEMVRQHAEILGNHVVDHVYEIGGTVTPEDFPLTVEPEVVEDLDGLPADADLVRGGACPKSRPA
jgi:hypothetical protein